MFITDDDGVVIDANPAAAELTGRERADMVGASVGELGPERDRELIERTGQDLLHEHALAATYEAVDGAGHRRVVEYSSVADFVPGEHLSIVREVTGRTVGTSRQAT